MKVRMLKKRSGAWFSGDSGFIWPDVGTVIDVPEVLAAEIIASGDGKAVEAPKPDPAPAPATRRKAVKSKRETRG